MALGDVNVFDLLDAFQKMLRRFERRDAKRAGVPDTVIFEENFTVADKIERLRIVGHPGAGAGAGVHGTLRRDGLAG